MNDLHVSGWPKGLMGAAMHRVRELWTGTILGGAYQEFHFHSLNSVFNVLLPSARHILGSGNPLVRQNPCPHGAYVILGRNIQTDFKKTLSGGGRHCE